MTCCCSWVILNGFPDSQFTVKSQGQIQGHYKIVPSAPSIFYYKTYEHPNNAAHNVWLLHTSCSSCGWKPQLLGQISKKLLTFELCGRGDFSSTHQELTCFKVSENWPNAISYHDSAGSFKIHELFHRFPNNWEKVHFAEFSTLTGWGCSIVSCCGVKRVTFFLSPLAARPLPQNTYKGHIRDAGPGFSYSCRKHFLLTNNETRVSGFF